MELSKPNSPKGFALSSIQLESLRVISLVVMFGSWAILPVYILAALTTGDQRYFSLVVAGTPLAVLSTVARIARKRGAYQLSLWILILSIIIVVTAFNFFIAGLGIIIAVLVFFVLINIAWQTMPRQEAIFASVVSFIGCLAIYAADAFTPPSTRIPSSLLLQQTMVVVGGLTILIFTVNLIRAIEFRTIGYQIRTTLIIISLVPIWVVVIPQILSQVKSLNDQANADLLRNANQLASELNTTISTLKSDLADDALLPRVIEFFKNPKESDSNIVVVLSTGRPYILSYALLDNKGINLLDTKKENEGRNEGNTIYFLRSSEKKQIYETYVSDVFLLEDGQAVFYVSTPVVNELNELLGVIRVGYEAKMLQEFIQKEGGFLGEGFTAAIVDDHNIFVAHNIHPEYRQKLVSDVDAVTLSELQTENRLPAGNISDLTVDLAELSKNLETSGQRSNFQSQVSVDDSTRTAVAVAELELSGQNWKILIAQDPAAFLAPVYVQIWTVLIIVSVVILAVIFAAGLITNLLSAPINELASAAEKIGRGELNTTVRLTRQDEIGTLSVVLDNTTKQLNDTLQSLESRVQERTAELTLVNEKNTRRAAQLEAVAQIARAVTGLTNIEQLLPEITKNISAAFGYYHAGIFLIDEKQEYAVLRAANSEGGQKMLRRGHKLKVGREGIVGYVTNTGNPRIALDVGEDAVFFNNPDLPATRSELALPLRFRDEIIGALDVQSSEASAFTDDDVKTLTLLSDQVSIALENARLFEETRTAFNQLQQIYAETIGTGLQGILHESGVSGFRFTKGNVEPLRHQEDGAAKTDHQTLEVPIVLRGERLGALRIRQPGRNRPWSEAETRMYQSIVERMSFALENARLFSDARRRANFERLASEASTKISSSVRFETILRTAAEEISRILGGSDVLVQIQPDVVDGNSGNKPHTQN